VSMDDIRVVAADTETTPVDIGSWISGGAYVSGNAVKLAAPTQDVNFLKLPHRSLRPIRRT